jgi:hypothetical protein
MGRTYAKYYRELKKQNLEVLEVKGRLMLKPVTKK